MISFPSQLELGGRRIALGWARVGEGTLASLSPGEQALMGPRVVRPRMQQFVAGRTAAAQALASIGLRGEVLRTPASEKDAGRPYVSGIDAAPLPPVAISLSHSGMLACAAVAEGRDPLGIDLEAAALEEAPSFLEEAFAPGELQGFGRFGDLGVDPVRAAWTLKEAVLKVWGVGLRVPLRRLQLQPTLPEPDGPWIACGVAVHYRGPNPPPPRMEARIGKAGGAVLSLALPA